MRALVERRGRLIFALAAAVLAAAVLASCASMGGQAKYKEAFAPLQSVPEGKAVVYMYHGKDSLTGMGGQRIVFFPKSLESSKPFNTVLNAKMPGAVWTYPNEAARFVVDPEDRTFVAHTLFPSSAGGGTQKRLSLELEGLEPGVTAYIEVSLNGFLKEIRGETLPEEELLPKLQGAVLVKPFF